MPGNQSFLDTLRGLLANPGSLLIVPILLGMFGNFFYDVVKVVVPSVMRTAMRARNPMLARWARRAEVRRSALWSSPQLCSAYVAKQIVHVILGLACFVVGSFSAGLSHSIRDNALMHALEAFGAWWIMSGLLRVHALYGDLRDRAESAPPPTEPDPFDPVI